MIEIKNRLIIKYLNRIDRFYREWNSKNHRSVLFSSLNFLGIGIVFDANRMMGGRKELWMFEITLLFIKFWRIQYKKRK